MSQNYKCIAVPSSDGVHQLSGRIYLPKQTPKGIFHIVHGMTEHIERYDRFMTDLSTFGYICCGYDNLGHGNTVNSDSELGFIAHKDGHKLLAEDVGRFASVVKKEYGEDIPYILLGHSMGSFIVRYSVSQGFVKPARLILMGSAGENKAAGMGLLLIALIKLIFGEHHFSSLIDKIAFGSYNDHFGGGSKDDPKPWLTTDEEIRKKYYADKFCSFNFSVSAMGDLIRLIKLTNNKDWYEDMPKKLPILLVAGNDDPVGNYGKGIFEINDRLKAKGADVKYILYDGARHEILNEPIYETVKNDIINFI